MSRITEYENGLPYNAIHKNNHRLKLTTFTLNLFTSSQSYFPETSILVFLPRVTGNRLEVNGSKIRPDSPSFITLHRIMSNLLRRDEVEFSCKDRVVVSDGVAFEVHVGEMRLLKGVFRENVGEDTWRMECKRKEFVGVKAVVVCVGGKSGVLLRENVCVERKGRSKGGLVLEGIPEGIEGDSVEEEVEEEEGDEDGVDEVVVEKLGWGVELGIWVVCLGVGLIVYKVSTRSLLRRRLVL